MTRINCIPTKELTDQHLIAEYRELPMVGASLRRSLRSKAGLPTIPKKYCLGRGHVSFFYDKGQFLCDRFFDLVEEMQSRGFKPNYMERKFDLNVFRDNGLYNNWEPDNEARETNRHRIEEKLAKRPGWYRYKGKPLCYS